MSEKMARMNKILEMDEQARNMCKPYGCKVMFCLRQYGNQECAGLMTELNQCLDKTKRELAHKYGLA